jgi:hypothetical protein
LCIKKCLLDRITQRQLLARFLNDDLTFGSLLVGIKWIAYLWLYLGAWVHSTTIAIIDSCELR